MINPMSGIRRFLPLSAVAACLALALATSLAACSTQPANPSSPSGPTVSVTPAMLGAEATAIVKSFESAVAVYAAQNPRGFTADVKAKIASAEAAADAAAAAIGTADVSTAATTANSVVSGLVAIAATLPAGALPPQAQAGLIAFQVLVAALQPIVDGPTAALGAMPTTGPMRVLLVPNPKQ